MFGNLIVAQFNNVVRSTIKRYSEKYNSSEIQLLLYNNSGKLAIQILESYIPKEIIGISELNIPIIGDDVAEGKILNSLENFKPEIAFAKCMILIKDGDIVSFIYDSNKPIRKIDISKII